MMPPARAALEHDPTMRAASPPLIPSSLAFRSTNFTTTNTNINANINTNNTPLTPTTTNTTTITTTNAFSTNPVINNNYIPPNSNSPIYGARGKQDMYASSRTDLASYGDDDDQSCSTTAANVSPSATSTSTKQQNAFMGNMANVCIKVVGSNIKPNDKGKEVVSFILSVGSYKDDTTSHEFEEKWRVEKLYSDFLTLDSKASVPVCV
jgi:hypothetical protein